MGARALLTARAVYDGGESKDGRSVICLIMRHAEGDGLDMDDFLFCYLKIASRLWHQPFSVLIDTTFFQGTVIPHERLFKAIDLLTPTEMRRNLQTYYIYNINSAYKRFFRRLMRNSAKNADSAINPSSNLTYTLVGSLQELQQYFHLSQLHLPKETINVVTDTRYMYQPVTRLSKSKGKIDVVIKVGSQYVQVTTCKRQEIVPGAGMSTTINDIFKLSDIDEAPTSIQTEDESAFGLRADGGKVVMYFTSPKKAEILQQIRSANLRHNKDPRTHIPMERLIRPQDVPGTLLNLALTNMSSDDHSLRLSSYNLLSALCKAFNFTSAARLMGTKELFVPLSPIKFVVNISKELARSEPQLTLDFLTEFFVGWDSFTDQKKALSIAYMAPWLPGLRTEVLISEPEAERGKEKVAMILRRLIDLAVSEPLLAYTLEQTVWLAIAQDEALLDIFLEEVIKAALNRESQDEPLGGITTIITGIGSITLRGKVLAKLRKALNRSSLRPSRYLPDNSVWPEICVLLQLCLALSFNNTVQAQLFLPEVFHIVTMLANTGSQIVRTNVYNLLINTVHSLWVAVASDETKAGKLKASLDVLCEPRGDFFSTPASSTRDGASGSTIHESGSPLAATENLAAMLFDICAAAAPSINSGNTWRSRWMSLVASTAFQNNPAIQPRAFSVMGYLAREEVDDDLLYQVLVALRNSVSRFNEDCGSEMLVSIITSLSKMMSKLPSASRYGLQLFWLAISLVRLVPINLFNCAANFLEAVLANIGNVGDVRGENMVPILMRGRTQLEDVALRLDDAYGIHFNVDNFHFAVCACLVRRLTDNITRASALRILSSFLEMTTWTSQATMSNDPRRSSPYFALLLARANGLDELKENLWLAEIGMTEDDSSAFRAGQDIESIDDDSLVLMSAIELVDFKHLDHFVQSRTLRWLNRLATARPNVIKEL